MPTQGEALKEVSNFFEGNYDVVEGWAIPDVEDIAFGKVGRELELAMLFIDIRESTKIVDGFRRITAAKIYKSFLWGVARIARTNEGELRSFNGDGVLVVFNGEHKRTHAAKAALQMTWFVRDVLKPKLEEYFSNNQQLQDFNFGFGIGVDVGKVLVVRGGIRGENNNDLVWVGNATNYAVKLSALSHDSYSIFISKDVYTGMNDSSKFSGDPKRNMWEERSWTSMDNEIIYRSSWQWALPT